jgi:hypothetical protein
VKGVVYDGVTAPSEAGDSGSALAERLVDR